MQEVFDAIMEHEQKTGKPRNEAIKKPHEQYAHPKNPRMMISLENTGAWQDGDGASLDKVKGFSKICSNQAISFDLKDMIEEEIDGMGGSEGSISIAHGGTRRKIHAIGGEDPYRTGDEMEEILKASTEIMDQTDDQITRDHSPTNDGAESGDKKQMTDHNMPRPTTDKAGSADNSRHIAGKSRSHALDTHSDEADHTLRGNEQQPRSEDEEEMRPAEDSTRVCRGGSALTVGDINTHVEMHKTGEVDEMQPKDKESPGGEDHLTINEIQHRHAAQCHTEEVAPEDECHWTSGPTDEPRLGMMDSPRKEKQKVDKDITARMPIMKRVARTKRRDYHELSDQDSQPPLDKAQLG